MSVADPKPARRIVDKNAGVDKILYESCCRVKRYALETELDQLPDIVDKPQPLTRHHLVARSLGGDDVDENLIPLGAYTHDLYETSSGERRRVLGGIIRRGLTTSEVEYVVREKGWAFLDRYYPAPEGGPDASPSH